MQLCIRDLVGDDQTGFIKNRCISDNFVYATEFLSSRHKCRTRTVVLKLDFRKAFESIKWESLHAILEVRGFDDRWHSWISSLFVTWKTTIMLNEVPGRWVNCKQGLQQGDPLSPYLFITVVDILRALIHKAYNHGLLSHPLVDDRPPVVLQYADDTLILLRGDLNQVNNLKSLLDDFAHATGLVINLHKSTFFPMNLDPKGSSAIVASLGCPISSFPQPYLDLPLSHTKLHKCRLLAPHC